jgi:DNA-binding protein HU-beta
MNKADLVAKMADSAGIPKAVAAKALNAFTTTVTKALKKGNKVTLVGFGTFSVAKRKARNGVNPQTGEKIRIKARKVPKFTCGKALKDSVK